MVVLKPELLKFFWRLREGRRTEVRMVWRLSAVTVKLCRDFLHYKGFAGGQLLIDCIFRFLPHGWVI